MIIIIISSSYHKFKLGGAELQMKYLIEYLSTKNITIHYVFLNKEVIEKKDGDVYLHGIGRKNRLLEWFFGEIIYYNDVYHLLESVKPNAIYHRNLGTLAFPIIQYSKQHKVKTVFHIALINDVIKKFSFSWNIISSLIYYHCKNKLIQNFDHIIAQAKYQDTLLKKNYGRNADFVMPNAHPIPKMKDIQNEGIRVLWVANLKPAKRPELFVRLASQLKDLGVEFAMVGRDPHTKWSSLLKNEIAKVSCLKYYGALPIDEVNELFSESSIFVNTSEIEGFPNTFIQAWMRSVPVVSLSINPDNIITDNNLGYHSKSFQQLIKDVEILIHNEDLRQSLGTNANKYALVNYTVSNFNKLYTLIKS